MSRFSAFHTSLKVSVILAASIFSGCTFKKDVSINYLNQKSPGMSAELFAPGIISTQGNEHSALAFSPDGSVVLWAMMDSNFRGNLFEMRYTNGTWSKPARPSFADTTADDYSPSFSADGQKLFFSSRRQLPGYAEGRGNRIWSVEKTADGWGTPVPFDTTVSKASEFVHSISKNGTLYFSALPKDAANLNIYKAETENTQYTKPVLLPYNINSVGYEDGPYISPDEDFLIFESTRPEGIDGSHDLYISFKTDNEQWGIPVNMGPEINSVSMERFPRLSPDGKYLFFASNRDKSNGKVGFDIYWIDAKIIESLKGNVDRKVGIEQSLGDELLTALKKNEITQASGLLEKWLTVYPHSLDATLIYSSVLRKQNRYSDADQLLTKAQTQWSESSDLLLELALVKFGMNQADEGKKLLATPLISENKLRNKINFLSTELFSMANYNLSDEYFDQAMSANPNRAVSYYNRACAYALVNEKDRAFKALEEASDLGYNTKEDYTDDPDLKSLKTDGRWKALLKKLK